MIPLRPQLAIFHRQRVARILNGTDADKDDAGGWEFLRASREGRAMGGNAASFLTSF